jgi:GT2 family glycosyltransferase
MGVNAGFAAAVNCGWRAAKGEWVAILNSDVELDPHWLERLLEGAGQASFATGKILSAGNPSMIDGTYDLLCRSGCAWRAGHGQPDSAVNEKTKPISIAPATACLFRRSVLEELNGLDESYGSYLEDVDLGLRCLSLGFTGVYVPAARAWHHGSATLGRWNPAVVRLISRNQLKLISKHYDRAFFRSCLWPILAGQLLWGLVALRHGAFRAWLAGKRDALAGFRLEGKPSPELKAFLIASEQEIENSATDAYWNLYFRCCPARPS